MKKLIKGIVDFRKNVRPLVKDTFARLALGQSPDVLFIACSDSRVVPNLFASTDPGDLFVVRNVGNLVPPCGDHGKSVGDESEAAAIEFALMNLKVKDVIVCGHSECGAIHAICNGRQNVPYPNLQSWLSYGEEALGRLQTDSRFSAELPRHNQVSQLNVLLQLEHLKTYPVVQDRLAAGDLTIHGWWFDIANADVFSFDADHGRFVLIDEPVALKILRQKTTT